MNSSATKTKIIQNLNKFRLITFDAKDTLVKYTIPPPTQYNKIADIFGYKCDESKLSSSFRSQYNEMFKNHPNFGKHTNLDWREWWRQLNYNIFIDAGGNIPTTDLKKISDILIILYGTDSCWKKIDGVDQLIGKIKEINKKIAIISNFDQRLHQIVHNLKLPDFDFIITSFEIGYLKPNEKMFKKALELSGDCISSEALHIGTSLELDYMAAINAGWSSILIADPNDEFISTNPNVNKEHVFDSIVNMLNTLENNDIKW